MVRIPSDNIWVIVIRESYFFLRPKIEMFGNGPTLSEIGD